tara:strand:+ start:14635 stop:15015 length:381 start_codon:yes stop_codon:yes gene_type:complete
MNHGLTIPEQQAFVRAAHRLIDVWQIADRESMLLLGLTRDEWLSLNADPSSCCFSDEQIFRVSALIGVHAALMVIYSGDVSRVARWIMAENSGTITQGRKPLIAMLEEGVPMMNRLRAYLEAEVAS